MKVCQPSDRYLYGHSTVIVKMDELIHQLPEGVAIWLAYSGL